MGGRARLAGSKDVAFLAQAQVGLGKLETVGRVREGLQARSARVREFVAMHGDAQRGQGGASDAPAQLMKLGKAELLGVEDNHEGRLRHVDANLDDGCGDEEGCAPGGEILHDLRLDGRGRASRQLMDGDAGQGGVGAQVRGDLLDRGEGACALLLGVGDVVRGVDARAHDVDATPLGDLLRGPRPRALHPRGIGTVGEVGGHRGAPRRHPAHACIVEISEDGHGDRSRNRCRSHDEFVNRTPVLACPAQRGSLLDAEAMLFVDDDESQVRETHALLEESVGSHDDEGLGGVHRALNLAAGGRRRRTRQQPNVRGIHPQGLQERPQGGGVLLCQDLGRRDERPLVTSGDHLEQRAERDDGLARSHVSLQEPLHRHLTGQVGPNLGDRLALGVRELKRQRLPETLAQRRVDRRGQRRHGPHAPALRGQPHLEDERLGEGQGLARLLVVLVRLGLMQGAQALGVGVEAGALADIDGNRVGHIGIVQVIQHHADCSGDRPRGQRSGRRVDRDGARGDALDVLPVHALEGGMGELQLAAVGPDLAGEEEGLPRRQETFNGGELILVLREEGR